MVFRWETTVAGDQGCGIAWGLSNHFRDTESPPLYGGSLWEALFVVSQKWSFPTALLGTNILRSTHAYAPFWVFDAGVMRDTIVLWWFRQV